jgi:CelD/BcsL family acetyltransferase involved in cellulose biosynthesis
MVSRQNEVENGERGALSGEVIREIGRAQELAPEWDILAVCAGRPYCAPSWLLAWWRHAAPPTAELSIVAVHGSEGLLGLAPFYSSVELGVTVLRPLAHNASPRVEPVTKEGFERQVAAVILDTLEREYPRPSVIHFYAIPATSPWPGLFAAQGCVREHRMLPSPFVRLEGASHTEWFSSQTAHFRKRMRAGRRRLEKHGAAFRLADDDDLEHDLRSFAKLHYARWMGRGGSRRLDWRLERMLLDAARELVPQGRLRIWSLDARRETIASEIFLAAGGEVAAWLGGFDDAWAGASPSFQLLLTAIEDSFERGETRFDLGPTVDDKFKFRLSDRTENLMWCSSVSARAGFRIHALTALTAVPHHIGARLSAKQKSLVRRVIQRV